MSNLEYWQLRMMFLLRKIDGESSKDVVIELERREKMMSREELLRQVVIWDAKMREVAKKGDIR